MSQFEFSYQEAAALQAEGLTHSQIARHMGVTEAKVDRLLAYARARATADAHGDTVKAMRRARRVPRPLYRRQGSRAEAPAEQRPESPIELEVEPAPEVVQGLREWAEAIMSRRGR